MKCTTTSPECGGKKKKNIKDEYESELTRYITGVGTAEWPESTCALPQLGENGTPRVADIDFRNAHAGVHSYARIFFIQKRCAHI